MGTEAMEYIGSFQIPSFLPSQSHEAPVYLSKCPCPLRAVPVAIHFVPFASGAIAPPPQQHSHKGRQPEQVAD